MGVDYKASVVVGVLLTDEQVMLVRDSWRPIERDIHQCGDFICGTVTEYVVGVSLKRTGEVGYSPICGDLDFYSHGVTAAVVIDTFNERFGDKVTLDAANINSTSALRQDKLVNG